MQDADEFWGKSRWSPYAPIRWRDTFWWKYAKAAAADGWVRADGRIGGGLVERIQQQLIGAMTAGLKERLQEMPEQDRGHMAGQLMAKYAEQRHWVPLIGQYEANGRQIFDLHDCLTEALLQTDVGSCTLEDLALPFDCFYLAFGKQESIKVPWEDDFEYADGAFVASTPWADTGTERRFKIGLSTVKKDGSGVMMPGYFLDFTPEEGKLPVQEAIDNAIERRKAVFFHGVVPGSQEEALAMHRAGELEEGGILARKALLLVFNAMFYLESLKSVPDVSPGRDTSPEMSAKWHGATGSRRRKLQSELTANGYAVVRLVGTEIAEAVEAAGGRPDGVRAHWRRGFYRDQPYGPGKAMKRRQWIRPVIVNAHKAGKDDMPGHVYVSGGDNKH